MTDDQFDDLIVAYGKLSGATADSIPLLIDALHAVRHRDLSVADEFIDRVLLKLQPALRGVREVMDRD